MNVKDIKIGDKVTARSMITFNTYEGSVINITDSSVIYKTATGVMSFPKAHIKSNLSIKINGKLLI